MKKEEILQNRKEDYIYSIHSLREKMVFEFLLGAFLTSVFVIPGMLTKAWLAELSTCLFLMGTAVPSFTISDLFLKHKMIQAEKKKCNHLDSVSKHGIKKNRFYEKKRVEKITELEQSLNYGNGLFYGSAFGIVGSLLGMLAGGVATLLYYPGYLVTLASIGSFGVFSALYHNECQKRLDKHVTIDGLYDDLFLGPFYGYNPSKNKGEVSFTPSKVEGMGKEKTKSHYDEVINAYVDGLAEYKENSNRYQKIKK